MKEIDSFILTFNETIYRRILSKIHLFKVVLICSFPFLKNAARPELFLIQLFAYSPTLTNSHVLACSYFYQELDTIF